MSTPHCSLILYLDQDTSSFEPFLQDVRSFFLKFPLPYEVIVCLEQDTELPMPTHPEVRLIKNATHLGRAASLWQGLLQARGEFRALTTADMNTPLGDIFKLFQYCMTESETDLIWGNRYGKKGSPFLKTAHKREQNEDLFNRILKEKFSSSTTDPLSDIVVLKAKTVNSIAERPGQKAPQGWYLAPYLLKAVRDLRLKSMDVVVHDSGQTPARFSLWRARWSLFKQSVL